MLDWARARSADSEVRFSGRFLMYWTLSIGVQIPSTSAVFVSPPFGTVASQGSGGYMTALLQLAGYTGAISRKLLEYKCNIAFKERPVTATS